MIERQSVAPTFKEALAVWAKIGVLSFGGPAGQIALMHRVLVDERRWIGEDQFLRALNFCMLLPGPEAMQLATFVGWRLHGTLGGLVAGLLFVLPGALVVLALSIAYALYGHVPVVEAAFVGIKAAVLVIVIEALLRVARRALRRPQDWIVAAAAFIAIFFFAVPFPLVIAAAALIGYLLVENRPQAISPTETSPVQLTDSLRTAGLWLALWIVPLVLVALLFGRDHVLTDMAIFFSKLAVVTFGGAYSVLAYMAQQAVETYGWLSAGEMLDGLGLAETTPGPLILVTEFVGFLAGYRHGGDPKLAFGLAGAADHAMGNLRTLLPVDLRGRALRGASQHEPPPRKRAERRYRSRGRRHSQLEPMVRAARFLRQGRGGSAWSVAALVARLLDHRRCSRGARVPCRGSAASTEARHRRHARNFRERGACLVHAVRSGLALARNPEIDEGRPHPSAAPPGVNACEGRRNPSAAARVNLGERRPHIGAVVAVVTAIVFARDLLNETGPRLRLSHAGTR